MPRIEAARGMAPLSCSVVLAVVLASPACRAEPPRVLDAPAGTAPAPAAVLPPLAYTIGPGDVLRVNVFAHPELSSGEWKQGGLGSPVDGSGQVMLPLLGAVPVAGATVVEVGELLEQRLARYLREPHVDVAVLEFGSQRFVVCGAVRAPGVYVLERPTSVLEALARAGGPDEAANLEQIAWVHGPLRPENLRLFDASEIDPVGASAIASGDLIYVGRRGWAYTADAARDVLPILQAVVLPLSVALQAATLTKL